MYEHFPVNSDTVPRTFLIVITVNGVRKITIIFYNVDKWSVIYQFGSQPGILALQLQLEAPMTLTRTLGLVLANNGPTDEHGKV